MKREPLGNLFTAGEDIGGAGPDPKREESVDSPFQPLSGLIVPAVFSPVRIQYAEGSSERSCQ